MGILSKALVYLACLPLGLLSVFVAHVLIARLSGPCAAPCDAPAIGLVSELIFLGPVIGFGIGHLVATWLEGKRQPDV